MLPQIARAAVQHALTGQQARLPRASGSFLGSPHPVFVTIRDGPGRLRGCVGTLSPRCATVVEETWRMAREAALSDSRFDPVRLEELAGLRFEVSVVSPLEPVGDTGELDPVRYGVVVSTPDGRRGALLPDVEGVNSVSDQLSIARRKGGIGPTERAEISRFTVLKYGG